MSLNLEPLSHALAYMLIEPHTAPRSLPELIVVLCYMRELTKSAADRAGIATLNHGKHSEWCMHMIERTKATKS